MLCTVVKTFLMLIKPTDSEQSLQPRGPCIQKMYKQLIKSTKWYELWWWITTAWLTVYVNGAHNDAVMHLPKWQKVIHVHTKHSECIYELINRKWMQLTSLGTTFRFITLTSAESDSPQSLSRSSSTFLSTTQPRSSAPTGWYLLSARMICKLLATQTWYRQHTVAVCALQIGNYRPVCGYGTLGSPIHSQNNFAYTICTPFYPTLLPFKSADSMQLFVPCQQQPIVNYTGEAIANKLIFRHSLQGVPIQSSQ